MTYSRCTATLGVAPCLLLALVGQVEAQAQPSAEHRSSWQTTTNIEQPFLLSLPKVIATGSLPAIKPVKPEGRLMGPAHKLNGLASYYWQGQKTATGENFDKTAMTAAHKTLPFNTRVRVTNLDNGRAVVVRINDRGPFKAGRVIDLSDAAAGVIDMRSKGLAPVKLEVVK